MNVLLIQPFFRKSEKGYPLGLGYISSALKQKGHSVFGVDMSFCSLDRVYSLLDKNKIDIIGVSLMSYNFKNAIYICSKLKDYKSLPIVAGGPHVTIFKEKLLKDYKNIFDYLIIGEGEHSFFQLLDLLERGKVSMQVDNLIYLNNGNVVINEIYPSNINLDTFPFPDRDILPIHKYKGMFTRNNKYTQIVTSRGCNHKCRYCPESALWSTWRGRSVGNVISEIKSIISSFGIREFHIEDANLFGGGVGRIRDFCQQLIDMKLNIKWQCPNGIPAMDIKDDSILELMAKAGCYCICLGIETFEKNILNSMDRPCDFISIKKIVKIAHKVGIDVTGYFIIGFPEQSLKSIKNDISLSRRLNLDFLHYSNFQLIPGSSLFYSYSDSLDARYALNPHLNLSNVDRKSLKKMRILSSLLSLFNPRPFLFILKSIIMIRNPFRLLRRAIVYLLGADLRF